jgi:hypothetical protein
VPPIAKSFHNRHHRVFKSPPNGHSMPTDYHPSASTSIWNA